MKKIITIYCILLFLVIFYPIFMSTGQVFSLDYLFPVQLSSESCVWRFDGLTSGMNYLWCYLRKILPDFMHFRLVIILTFGLLMTGGYYLARQTKNIYAILFCITFLCINPFFYGRIMDGQVNVFLVSALFVWFVYFLRQAFQTRLLRYYPLMAVMTAFMAMTSIYALYLAAFSYAIFFCVYFCYADNKKRLFQGALILLLLALVLNAFWYLSPQRTALVQRVAGFEVTFSTSAGLYGSPLNVALLRGYWGETQNRFVTLEQFYKYPAVGIGLMALIWLCVVFGIIHLWKHKAQRPEMMSFVALGLLGYVLTLGTDASSPFRAGVQLLYDHLPFYQGFREPQKWMILLLIAYAYLGAYGVKELYARMAIFQLRKIIILFFIIVSLISTPLMLFGFIGQLKPLHYPREYSEVRDFLSGVTPTKQCENRQNKKGGCYTFLYFPWYNYIGLEWIGKTTNIDSIVSFMTPLQTSLYGDNDMIGSSWSTSTRPESHTIEGFIRHPGKRVNALEQLQEMHTFRDEITKMGIQYIIVLRDNQYSGNYLSFLDECVDQAIFTLVRENSLIKVYKI